MARARFPRGLFQPPGAYRFAADALLLASFLPAPPGARLLDLGAGCGVAALGMLCRCEGIVAHGLDSQPALVAAARENASRLGFSRRFAAFCRDLASETLFAANGSGRDGGRSGRRGRSLWSERLPEQGAYDLALANPPFRRKDQGRLPRSEARRVALFEEENTLFVFCRTASQALTANGRLGLVYPAARRDDLFAALEAVRLRPLRLVPVRARKNEPASLLLVEAGRSSPKGLALSEEAALSLHEGEGEASRFSEEALAFCPWLRPGKPGAFP